jgi:hypothetical protein
VCISCDLINERCQPEFTSGALSQQVLAAPRKHCGPDGKAAAAEDQEAARNVPWPALAGSVQGERLISASEGDVVSVVSMVMIMCSAVARTCTSYERPSVLQARGVMPEHVPMIATMPRLAHLSLKRCRGVTNACLADLAPLTGLSSLSLARCYQVIAAAGHSSGVQDWVRAEFWALGSTPLACPSGHPQQCLFTRTPCQITDSGLSMLAKVAPQLTALNISHVYRVTNAGVAAVAQMTRLETLAITRQVPHDVT